MKSESPGIRTLDLRGLIADGGEPFPTIMRAVAGLAVNETLLLVTPFLPSPLIEKLQSEGFEAHPERMGDGSWQTRFTRE